MKFYKLHFYQAYRADECGTRWLPFIPTDSDYQKSEVLQEREVTLPDGVTYNKENNVFAYKGKAFDCELVNEADGSVSLVTSEEVINLF